MSPLIKVKQALGFSQLIAILSRNIAALVYIIYVCVWLAMATKSNRQVWHYLAQIILKYRLTFGQNSYRQLQNARVFIEMLIGLLAIDRRVGVSRVY